MISYRQANLTDVDTIAILQKQLYSADNTIESLGAETEKNLKGGNLAVFFAFDGAMPIGFCEVSLRRDYVEGTEGGTVGYIEGVFVLPEYRGRHIAKELIKLSENWAKEKGCDEFASDCELDNAQSLQLHLKTGFKEAGRNIHFVKKL